MDNSDALGLEVTWNRTLKVWWSYLWRCVLWSLLAGVVLGAIIGVCTGLLGKPELASPLGEVAGRLASIPVSIFALRIILRKRFKEFSIKLIEQHEEGVEKGGPKKIIGS